MDFIRSLDDDENPPASSSGVLTDSFVASLGEYTRTVRRESIAKDAPFRHQPIKHRISSIRPEDALSGAAHDTDSDGGVEDAAARARRDFAHTHTGVVGVRPTVQAASVRAFETRMRDALVRADLDAGRGDVPFRPHEADNTEAGPGFVAGLGPGTHTQVSRGPLARSTLTALNGYKTRDLFASHARRTKSTRDEVAHDAAKNPDGHRYRTTADHVLSDADFAPMRKVDRGYHAGADADLDSAAHPEVMLGLHRLRPTVDEKRLEAEVAELSAQHMKRRLAEQTLQRSIRDKVTQFGRALERREEETTRRQEDAYRQLFDRQDATERQAAASQKSRPVSAPMVRVPPAKKHRVMESTSSNMSMAEDDEDPAIVEEHPGRPLTREERDLRDPRTAVSHIDVQLMQHRAREAAEADARNTPAGFSMRPSTAGRLRVARWADEATRGAADRVLEHGHGNGAQAGGRALGHSHSRSHLTSASSSSPSPATELLHRHRPGSAALSLHAHGDAPHLPVPVSLIEDHFRAAAWSLERREESEIDSLSRDLADLSTKQQQAADTVEEEDEAQDIAVMEESIAGSIAARMKHEARQVERLARAEARRAAAKAAVKAARDSLRHKTDEWESHRMGIAPFGETEKDLTLAAVKARQLALVRAGIPVAKPPTHDVAFNSSVVKRKTAPVPKARVKKEGDDAAKEKVKVVRAPSGKKGPPAPKLRPAGVGKTTLAKSQALEQRHVDRTFVDGLYDSSLADALDVVGSEKPLNHSGSLYRSSQEPAARRRSRPFSAAPSTTAPVVLQADGVYRAPLQVVTAGGDPLPHGLAPSSSSQTLRPATTSLLGISVSHPQLLKSVAARASAVGGVMAHVHGHVHRSEALAQVDAVRDAMARAMGGSDAPNFHLSRAALERALVPPSVHLTADQQKLFPPSIGTHLAVNPFAVVKKKKKKGRKGSSKKKKRKTSDSPKRKVVEAEGLAFPLGTNPAEFANNPLVSDLGLINIGEIATSEDKALFRQVYLAHAPALVRTFDLFSARAATGASSTSSSAAHGGPPLMSQFKWVQFLSVCGVFDAASSVGPPVTVRSALQIFADDDDLSIENIDVDELISRPAFLERIARIAVAKCGTTHAQPAAAEPTPEALAAANTRVVPPAEALETFIIKVSTSEA